MLYAKQMFELVNDSKNCWCIIMIKADYIVGPEIVCHLIKVNMDS
mgnify:CR=1 FL=1